MDFLKELALPQSLEHYRLVVLLGTISALVFIPYLSFVVGASVLSLWYGRTGRQGNDPAALRFARTVIDLALYNKSIAVYLGVIPGLSLVFSYAQLLHATSASAAGIASVAFLMLCGGLALLFTHKHSFRVKSLIDRFELLAGVQTGQEDVREFKVSNSRLLEQSGIYGMLLMLLAAFLYAASYSIAADAATWTDLTSLLDTIVSAAVWVRFALFAGVVLGVTGLGILFFFNVWEGGLAANDADVAALAGRVGIAWSALALLEIPVLLLGNLALVSGDSMSGSVYALAGAALTAFFIAAHFLYGHHKTQQSGPIASSFFVFLLGLTVLTVNDHVVLAGGTKAHAVYLASLHEKALEELKARLGVGAAALTGEDIFNGKCSACHLFDQKKVGPPYFETVPKYAAKKADLIAFILNPQKINPAYPSMPGQGLKAAEADSIASYIMHKVAEAGKMKMETPQAAQK